jgi:circadian clock protein KaiC
MNGERVVIRRLATGVPGLDDVLGGGLPEFSFNLIAGPTGCGKTTLAHQMMFALATPQRRALYLTVLGEPALKMIRYQQQFDFFDFAATNVAVRFVNLSEETLGGDLDQVLQRIVAEVREFTPSFVFVDSFRTVVQATDYGPQPANVLQNFMQQLAMLMASWQATTFLVGEYQQETDAAPVFTIADGILWLRQSVHRNSMVRKLQVGKMRGQDILPGLHSFRIGPEGLTVFAPAIPARASDRAAANTHSNARASTGVPALDEMLGGGLPKGYSMLVAGPSGSGKSILATTFLVAGAQCGERGVLAAFEQRPDRARHPKLLAMIERGDVGVIDSRAPDLSIDEIVSLLTREIRRLGATRVVIDSLSGFELAVAPTFRADFRESLLGLVGALAAEGVSVLMTSELEDRYSDLRFSPYGTAFLTDAIVVQRYIEVDSRLRRVMAVVKVRASAHSDELREFHIDDDGIHVGARLVDYEGLLGGRPRRSHAPDELDIT